MNTLRALAAAACSLALLAGCGGSDDSDAPPKDATVGKVDARGRDVAVQPLMRAWVTENVPSGWRLGKGEFVFEDIPDDDQKDTGLDRTRYGVVAKKVSEREFLQWGQKLATTYDDIDTGSCEASSDPAAAKGRLCAISIDEGSSDEFAHMSLFAAWTGLADKKKPDTVNIYLEDSPNH